MVAVSASFKQTGYDGLLEELEQASELGSLKQHESEEQIGFDNPDEILEEVKQAAELASLEQHKSQVLQKLFLYLKHSANNVRASSKWE